MRAAALLTLTCFIGCAPEPVPDAGGGPLAVGAHAGLAVELWSDAPLAVGQSRVRYRVTRDGQPITRATLTQQPRGPSGGCPVLDPPAVAADDGSFEAMLFFTGAGAWELSLALTVEGATEPVSLTLGPLSVSDSTMKQTVELDARRVVVTWGYLTGPRVGRNEVLVSAHAPTDEGATTFTTVDALRFTVTPEMPSMGHGSSGNVDPVRGDDGLYRGTVVFSMTGDWVVHLRALVGDEPLATWAFTAAL